MTTQQLAVEIVSDADKVSDISRPMHNSYYLFFAGKHSDTYDYNSIKNITPKEWQMAKYVVFCDRFDMKEPV